MNKSNVIVSLVLISLMILVFLFLWFLVPWSKKTPGVDQGIYDGYFRRIYVNQPLDLGQQNHKSLVFQPDLTSGWDTVSITLAFDSEFMRNTSFPPKLQEVARITIQDLEKPELYRADLDPGRDTLDRGFLEFVVPQEFRFTEGHRYELSLQTIPIENLPQNFQKARLLVLVRNHPL